MSWVLGKFQIPNRSAFGSVIATRAKMIGLQHMEISDVCGLLYGLSSVNYIDEAEIIPDMLSTVRQELGRLSSIDLLLALSGIERLNVGMITMHN